MEGKGRWEEAGGVPGAAAASVGIRAPQRGRGLGAAPGSLPVCGCPRRCSPLSCPSPGVRAGGGRLGVLGVLPRAAPSFPCQASSCGTVPRERASAFPLERALAAFARSARPRLLCFPAGSLRSCLCSSAQLPAPRRAPASRSRGCGCPHGWVPGAQPRLLPSCRPLPQVDAGAGVCKGHQNLPGSHPALPEDWGASRGQPRPKEPRPAKKKNSEGASCRLELRICAATPSKQGVSSALLLCLLFRGL